jgi:hypothetical protein
VLLPGFLKGRDIEDWAVLAQKIVIGSLMELVS